MNLVAGVTNFPVPVGFNVSLTRSEDTVCRMEAQGQEDLAVVLMRNLAISQGLCAVDAPLLVLRVQEVRNFEWWERLVAAEEAPAQDRVEEGPQQDCFGMSVAQ